MPLLSGYDAWVTREPDWMSAEPPVYRCSCGCFLATEPDYRVEFSAIRLCDGKPPVMECEHDDRVLAIIGEEFRGVKHYRAWPAACGSRDGAPDRWHHDQDEIDPDKAAEWTHEPHFYEDQMGHVVVDVRVCSACGTENKETLF